MLRWETRWYQLAGSTKQRAAHAEAAAGEGWGAAGGALGAEACSKAEACVERLSHSQAAALNAWRSAPPRTWVAAARVGAAGVGAWAGGAAHANV